MNERTALQRAVIENLAENTPRLVFADWLDEHGDHDRAEFIRGQIQLSEMQPWDEDSWRSIFAVGSLNVPTRSGSALSASSQPGQRRGRS